MMTEGDWRDGPITKKYHGLQVNTRSWEKGMERSLPCNILKEPILSTPWFWTARTVREAFLWLSHPVCGDLL